jgi:hypothetical protein
MKSIIKRLLRENIFDNVELSPDDIENIKKSAQESFDEQENEKQNILQVIDNLKKYMNDDKVKNDKQVLEAVERLIKEKEYLLRHYTRTYDDFVNMYTRIRKENIVRLNAYDEDKKEKRILGITRERIIDAFITALEGGSNYWYDIQTLPNDVVQAVKSNGKTASEAIAEHILNGGYIQFHDIEDESEILGYVDMDKLLDAINLVKKDYPEVYENIVLEEYDAEDADIFLQLAVMGNVVFG